jgi:hypothetical protein
MKRSTISLNSAGSSRLSTWPDFGKKGQPRRGKMFLQKQAGLDARIVLVAADDQRGRRRLADRVSECVDRGPAALEAAHGVGRAFRIVPCQRCIEVGVPARVLDQEGNPARRFARHFGDFRRAEFFQLLGIFPALLSKRVEICQARPRANTGQSHRQRALGRVQADLQRRIGAHRQTDKMRFRDLQMIQHRERVAVKMLVGVGVGRRRHVGGRVAACGIGDTAVAAREIAHLRLPIGVVGREFMQEEDRRSATRLFEIEADIVVCDDMGHLRFLLLFLF